MATGILLFSRFDSSRLPGKALIEIGNRPLLGHVVDRARRVGGNADIILATTERAIDDPLVAFADSEGVAVFRGALDDVAGRALACCEAFGLARFARICGDRPFFDPDLVSRGIRMHEEGETDLVTTMMPRTRPPGLTVEVVSTGALANALGKTRDPEDREHVTRYFYRHPDEYRIANLSADDGLDYEDVRLVVDDETDLARCCWIVSRLPEPASTAPVGEILRLFRAWPDRAAS